MSLLGLWTLLLSSAVAGSSGQAIATQGDGQGAPVPAAMGRWGKATRSFLPSQGRVRSRRWRPRPQEIDALPLAIAGCGGAL